MADVRCPMCGKLNPEDNAECLHCGSRLKPLRVGDLPEQAEGLVSPAAPKTPAEKSPPPSSTDVTLLRQTLRDRGEPPAESDQEAPEAGALESEQDETPVWLRRLRAQSGLPSSPPQPRGEAKKATPQPEPPPQAQPQRPPPPEMGRRRTTGELLSSLRATVQQRRVEPEEPPAEAEASEDIPDWLGALRRHSVVQPEPQPPEPPPPSEPTADMPNWLLSLREHAVPEEAAGETLAPPTGPPSALGQGARGGPWGRGELSGGAAAAAELGQPPEEEAQGESLPSDLAPEVEQEETLDWLKLAQPPEAEESPAWPPLPTEASPGDQTEAPSGSGWPGQPADDFPEWLKTLASSAEEAPPAAASASERPNVPRPEAAPAPEPAEPFGETPDWLSTLGAPAAEVPAAEEPGETPDWLRTPDATAPGAPMEHPLEGIALPEEPPAGIPDWLQSLQDAGPVPEAPTEQTAALPDWLDNLPPPQLGEPAEAAPPGELDEVPMGTEAFAEPAEPASMPDWLVSLAPEPSAIPTQTAPFVQPEERPEFSTGPEAPQEAQAEAPGIEASVEVPAWLAAMRSPERPPDVAAPSAPQSPASASVPPFVVGEAPESMGYLPPEAGSPGDLERATLPAWLEAMRPLPVARPSPSTTAEYEETTGPLAGMKGMIAAEPAIALPTVRLSAAIQPAVSETHLAQARLIQALVKEEAAPRAAPRRPVARPIVALLERWLIFAALAVAVAAPFVLEGSTPMFGHPSLFPVETVAARDVVGNLPAGQPVLVAFEYEPGAAGEMDLLAGALLDHLASRGLPLVAVSTRPLGPALAQAALEASLLPQAGEAAQDRYVNLGYLPGGVMALPAFAADPRSLITGDFSAEMPDAEAPPPDMWQGPILFEVHSLADFGLIAVVSNSPEAVRAWIEQAAIIRGGILGPVHPPMIALVSASAEPLVQPYFLADSANSSLQGLVSGPFGATDYALLAGAAGGAAAEAPDLAGWRWDAQALGQLAAVVIIAAGALIFGSFSLLRRQQERPS